MKEVILYTHGGSENHGCEALVRSTNKILRNNGINSKITLFSKRINEDIKFGLDKICEVKSDRTSIEADDDNLETRYDNLVANFGPNKIALSIGGDNYCYGNHPLVQEYLSNKAHEKGTKTVLWECSISPELIKNERILAELKTYSLITTRETITYNNLKEAGVENVKMFADPAFVLDVTKRELPKEFIPQNTVGINISPLIEKHESTEKIVLKNYTTLINYILENTDMNICFIPHMLRQESSDLEISKKIYDMYKNTNRMCILDKKYNCCELKGFISRLKILVAARTHASIAGYSTCIPTLVVGYSVKAIGIAKDIFGTDEKYVLSVQNLQSENELTEGFKYIEKNYKNIKTQLEKTMPQYCSTAMQAGKTIQELE